jgi:hypothetical protein
MSENLARAMKIGLALLIGIAVLTGWFYYRENHQVRLQVPNASWEPNFFKFINKTTELNGMEPLRRLRINGDDFEVRVWRGGMGEYEGVVLKRANKQWNALHIKADENTEPLQTEIKNLSPPKSGWESLWQDLTEQGLLTLRDPSETNCQDEGLDGTSYIVEINHNSVYRTYHMREGGDCPGVRQMERIDDLIGEEFNSGEVVCTRAEWFACAELRKSRR